MVVRLYLRYLYREELEWKNGHREKIAAIKAGADEYIQRPDTVGEEIASAQALIRRYTDLNHQKHERKNTFFRCGVFINPEYRRVFINAQEIHFPRKEFDLFYLFACNPGRVFTHEQLYREVWGEEYIYISDNSLNSCLRRIRRKLSEVPDVPCGWAFFMSQALKFIKVRIWEGAHAGR